MSRLASYIKVKLPASCKECPFYFAHYKYVFPMCQGVELCYATIELDQGVFCSIKTPQEAIEQGYDCAFIVPDASQQDTVEKTKIDSSAECLNK